MLSFRVPLKGRGSSSKKKVAMNEASQYLLKLAKTNVKAYIAHPKAKAAMVTGSVALGISDYYSDIDMSIYYEEELPSEQELEAARQHRSVWRRLFSSRC